LFVKLPEEIEIFRKCFEKIKFFLPGSTTPQISNQIDGAETACQRNRTVFRF